MTLVHIAHEVLKLTRRCARRVLERNRHYRRSGEASVLNECTACDHGKRERSEQSEQPAQYSRAAFDIELQERTCPNGGRYRDRILFDTSGSIVHRAVHRRTQVRVAGRITGAATDTAAPRRSARRCRYVHSATAMIEPPGRMSSIAA